MCVVSKSHEGVSLAVFMRLNDLDQLRRVACAHIPELVCDEPSGAVDVWLASMIILGYLNSMHHHQGF